GDQERSERRDRGERGLDEMIVRGSGDKHRHEPDEKPDQKPASGDDDKGVRDREWAARMRRIVRGPGENQREKDRGGAVVDEALGLDQELEAPSHAGLAQ